MQTPKKYLLNLQSTRDALIIVLDFELGHFSPAPENLVIYSHVLKHENNLYPSAASIAWETVAVPYAFVHVAEPWMPQVARNMQ